MTESQPVTPSVQPIRRLIIPVSAVIFAVVFVVVAAGHENLWSGSRRFQTTNDAYVRAQTTRLSSKVAGTIKSIEVGDFQKVRRDEVLLRIDPPEYEAQVAQSEAGVAGAQAALDNLANQIELQYATIAQAEAQRVSLQAVEVQAEQEQERQQSLSKSEAGTRQKLEQAVAALGKVKADVKASSAAIAAQRHQLEVLGGTRKQRAADLLAAKANLRAAQLRLSYTTVSAPFDGIASERQVQAGDYVNIGSSLLSVVPLPDVYVIANFKETQLTNVKVGQPVELTVDTFSNEKLRGRIERISPATGSQFALLPPDNATGNFTKIIQRVPVRIGFDKSQPLLERLLPGMSVTATIDTADGDR